MPVPRPKILTAVTFDSAQEFKFDVSVAASLDTSKTATVAAGTYYLAWDGQSDDLLHVLLTAIVAQLSGEGATYYPSIRINTDNKVVIDFDGSHYVDSAGWENDVNLDLTASSADLCKALGFDTSADDTSTGTDYPSFTADYQHAYGWYSNADGQLVSLATEDTNITVTPQAISLSGRVTSQNIGQRFANEIELAWLDRDQTWSRGVGYTDASVDPYARNVPLECWWEAVRDGTQFRVYREGRNDDSPFIEYGTATAGSSSTMVDSGKSWATEPQTYKGKLATSTDAQDGRTRIYINSNDGTTLNAANANPNARNYANTGDAIYILDQAYQTYVVDLSRMSEFSPTEQPLEDYYGITIPLLRYES